MFEQAYIKALATRYSNDPKADLKKLAVDYKRVFTEAGAAGYRLTYGASGADRLHIRFEIAPPGGGYKTYTEGDVARR